MQGTDKTAAANPNKALKDRHDARWNHDRGPGYRAGWRGVALAVVNRNFIIYQYDEINREPTWPPFSTDLPTWKVSFRALEEAEMALGAGD